MTQLTVRGRSGGECLLEQQGELTHPGSSPGYLHWLNFLVFTKNISNPETLELCVLLSLLTYAHGVLGSNGQTYTTWLTPIPLFEVLFPTVCCSEDRCAVLYHRYHPKKTDKRRRWERRGNGK